MLSITRRVTGEESGVTAASGWWGFLCPRLTSRSCSGRELWRSATTPHPPHASDSSRSTCRSSSDLVLLMMAEVARGFEPSPVSRGPSSFIAVVSLAPIFRIGFRRASGFRWWLVFASLSLCRSRKVLAAEAWSSVFTLSPLVSHRLSL